MREKEEAPAVLAHTQGQSESADQSVISVYSYCIMFALILTRRIVRNFYGSISENTEIILD